MAKFPFGGFESTPESKDDPPWVRLKTIAEYLECGQPVPPFLAEWLFRAITYADEDPAKFLEHLELKRRPGRPGISIDEFLDIGKRLDLLVSCERMPIEKAIAMVQEELERRDPPLELSRTQLQRHLQDYRRILRIAWGEDE